MFVFAAKVKRKWPSQGANRYASDVVKSLSIRSAIVVRDSLAEMVAVPKGRVANSSDSRINGFHFGTQIARTIQSGSLRSKFACQIAINKRAGIRICLIRNAIANVFQHSCTFHACPWTNSQICSIDIPKRGETLQSGIDPAV